MTGNMSVPYDMWILANNREKNGAVRRFLFMFNLKFKKLNIWKFNSGVVQTANRKFALCLILKVVRAIDENQSFFAYHSTYYIYADQNTGN